MADITAETTLKAAFSEVLSVETTLKVAFVLRVYTTPTVAFSDPRGSFRGVMDQSERDALDQIGGDTAIITDADTAPAQYNTGSEWIEGETQQTQEAGQQRLFVAPTEEGWRIEIGDPLQPLRYTDGVSTPFYVVGSGSGEVYTERLTLPVEDSNEDASLSAHESDEHNAYVTLVGYDMDGGTKPEITLKTHNAQTWAELIATQSSASAEVVGTSYFGFRFLQLPLLLEDSDGTGGIWFADGTVAHDVSLSRTDVGEVTLDGDLIVTGSMGAGVPIPVPFAKTGTLTTGTGTMRYYPPQACTIVGAYAAVNTAPTGASIKVDINKSGTTIYTTQANRPTIAISGFYAAGGTPDVTTLATTDYLTVDIDQIGSTIAGADLTVIVRLKTV